MLIRLWLLLFCPAWALAVGGTQVTWLGGTQPYDTVPYREADLKAGLEAGSGPPQPFAELDAGLTDWWMLSGRWSQSEGGAPERWQASTRLKLHAQPRWGLGAAAYAGWRTGLFDSAAKRDDGLYYGLVLAWEGAAQSLALNADHNPVQGPIASAAYWGPYMLYAVRPGLEYGLGGQRWVLPQLAFNFPGDLSLDLGLRLGLEEGRPWRFISRLSFQLFPSP
jgi:hypothetical protein